MRFYTVALLTGATAAAAGNTANLLLPGFQGHDLQAGIMGKDGDATTYLITCPTSVAASACGIPGNGMTAISAPSSAQLINTNGANTASLSCNVAGSTYASCYAEEGTVTVQQTLAASNINWMAVTVTGDCYTSTPHTNSHSHAYFDPYSHPLFDFDFDFNRYSVFDFHSRLHPQEVAYQVFFSCR
ncbi:hypothetical protein N7494_004679 [Penicillium frequentans]|uniref:Ig-like domain-containing protein n=1 Tax=Penicillium frequentans TaxID=3151616 RepID=A0AAD6GIX3_9EURO|nr:hypothetical protein N7494_004679 [Penicillium glabrum]